MSPTQTLSIKPVSGWKKDKIRIMVLLSTNAIRTDMLKSWVISNSKHLRPLFKVNLNSLSIYYRANSKVWMNSSLFEEVLHELDSCFKVQDKKILLLVDNASSYFNPYYLSGMEINQNDSDDNESSISDKFFFSFFFFFFF